MANRGARWTPEQEEWLLATIPKKGKPYCAEAMGRTRGGLEARLCVMAHRLMATDAIPLDDAAALTFTTPEALAKYIAQETTKKEEKLARQEARNQAKKETGAKKGKPKQKALHDLAVASSSGIGKDICLTEEQTAAVEAIRAQQSVFLTGQAGTGKSATLKHVLAMARESELEYGVTATTGCAAVLIGGSTIHSFLGIGLATQPAKELAKRVAYNMPAIATKLRALDLLIIDEVSMLSDKLFTKVSEYLSHLRRNPAPFGGITVLLTGDFFQLPPVEDEFAFHSPEWKRLNPKVIQLTCVFRQATDSNAVFRDILARARLGKITKDDMVVLTESMQTTFPEGFQPTRLFPHRSTVTKINTQCYAALLATNSAAECTYETRYNHTGMKPWADKADIPEKVVLMPGAQVMVTWNVNQEEGIVNGTRGVVIACLPDQVVIKTLDNMHVTIPMFQICSDDTGPSANSPNFVVTMPLTLAYAITHHKSQGATLDAVEMDLGDAIFEYGQAYVALSRARNLSSVRITALKKSSFAAHPEVLEFYELSNA